MCLLETLGSEVEYKNRQSLVFKIDLDFLKLHNGNKEFFFSLREYKQNFV